MTTLLRLTEGRPLKISAVTRLQHGEEDGEEQAWFESLLQRTVPEHAWEILQMDNGWEQVLSFTNRFSMDHFPLDESYLEMQFEWLAEEEWDFSISSPYGYLQNGIPLHLMGFDWEERHDMWTSFKHGLSALALLAELPAQNEFETQENRGMREAWLESAADIIPVATLQRVPEGGIPLELLEETVRDTPLEAAHLAAQWICSRTGNFFLDESFPEDFDGRYPDPWDEGNIEYAGREWGKASKILDRIDRLTAWLEEDLPERFGQLLDLILKRLEEISGEPQGRDERENGL